MISPEVVMNDGQQTKIADRDADILRRFPDKTMADLGRHYDMSRERVRQILLMAGITGKDGVDQRHEAIARDADRGLTLEAIKRRRGVSEFTVRAAAGVVSTEFQVRQARKLRRAKALRAAGMGWKEISRRLGYKGWSGARELLSRAGVCELGKVRRIPDRDRQPMARALFYGQWQYWRGFGYKNEFSFRAARKFVIDLKGLAPRPRLLLLWLRDLGRPVCVSEFGRRSDWSSLKRLAERGYVTSTVDRGRPGHPRFYLLTSEGEDLVAGWEEACGPLVEEEN